MEPINFTAPRNRDTFDVPEEEPKRKGELKRVSTEGDKRAGLYLGGYKTGGKLSIDEYLKLSDDMRGSDDLEKLKAKANPLGAKIVKIA